MFTKQMGYAGRKFAGRRLLNGRTPGYPQKHSAWPGVHIPSDRTVKNGTISSGPAQGPTILIDLSGGI